MTAASDYAPAQLAAWARPEQRDPATWDLGMRRRNSFVAVVNDQIAGFSDVSVDGYIDMMFVSPRHGREGVATALLAKAEALARGNGAHQVSADVSITARPFFEHCGFVVEKEQHPITAGVRMTNFHMSKKLDLRGER